MNRNHSRHFINKAPAKIIISGEHATVLGNPAIISTIDFYCYTEIILNTSNKNICFNLESIPYYDVISIAELLQIHQQIKVNYQEYLNNQRVAKDILTKPEHLAYYIVADFISNTPNKKDKFDINMKINISSEFPIGIGLGSSAACIISLLDDLNFYCDRYYTDKKLFEMAKNYENLVHGKSSGIDVFAANNVDSCFYHRNGHFEKLEISLPNITIINSGAPQSTTAECVEFTSKKFANNESLLQQFTKVTNNIKDDLLSNNKESLYQHIVENNKLLIKLGVVPSYVQKFISKLEKLGIAAKITGAGAISGDNGGAIIAFSKNIPHDLLQEFNFEIVTLK